MLLTKSLVSSVLLSTATLLAQTPQTTITVNARLVNLPVVVRSGNGKLVTGLTKDDFVLTEDGRPETIRYFSLDTDLPLTLALAVDTDDTMRGAFDSEKSASQSFLDTMIDKPQDRAAILNFDQQVQLLEDLTPSKARLNDALGQLGPTTSGGGDAGGRGFGNQLYDAIYLASTDLLAKQTGRKAIIVLSNGEDHLSKESLREAIEAAQKAEAVVYTIYFKGEGEDRGIHLSQGQQDPNCGMGPGGPMGPRIGMGPMGRPMGGPMGPMGPGCNGPQPGAGSGGLQHIDGKKILQQIAGETGGRYYEARRKENFDGIYKQISDELRQQYMLGYTPDTKGQGDGFHRISLTTKKKNLYVQTRAGYYNTSDDDASKE